MKILAAPSIFPAFEQDCPNCWAKFCVESVDDLRQSKRYFFEGGSSWELVTKCPCCSVWIYVRTGNACLITNEHRKKIKKRSWLAAWGFGQQ